jgi:quinol monooxygenase YgiN
VPEPILYVDFAEVRDGRLQELMAGMRDLAAFVQANEPWLSGYDVYFNEAGTRMTVVHAHADAASLEHHMAVAGPEFSRFVDLVRLLTIDIYGTPSDDLLRQILGKAELLGPATVTVHRHAAGFTRQGDR